MYLPLDSPGETLGELTGIQNLIFIPHQLEARLIPTAPCSADRRKKHRVVETARNDVTTHEECGLAIEEHRPVSSIAGDGLLISG